MNIRRLFATLAESDDFAAFECWNGNPIEFWALEAENYIRVTVLRADLYCLAFRSEADELVAVTAYYRRTVAVPLLSPSDQPAWHIEVMGVSVDYQGRGLSRVVLQETFRAMKEIDDSIVLVTAFVHDLNEASLRACSAVGLDPYFKKDSDYWVLLGELK